MKLELEFEFARETKDAYRYAESGDPRHQKVGSLDFQKWAFAGTEFDPTLPGKLRPDKLRVEIVA